MDPDRAEKEKVLFSPLLSLASLNPARRTANFPSTSVLPFVPAAPSLQTAAGGGTLSENEKAPPPPEFSPVTIGSLARGTNSGLHDAGPFLPPLPYGSLPRSLVRSPFSTLFSYSSFYLQAWIAAAWCPIRLVFSFRSVDSRIARAFNRNG